MGKMKYTCPWVRRNQTHTKSKVQISFEVGSVISTVSRL